jgi:DNA-binding Lrp family transcriptional regulator
MSFRGVSKQLGTAIDTISRRYERLKQNGTIKPIIQINPQKLGYHAYLAMDIRLTREGNFQAAFDKISELKNCLVIVHCSGECDLVVQFIIKNLGDLLEIQDKVKEIPNIIVTQISTDRCGSIYPAPREQISTI